MGARLLEFANHWLEVTSDAWVLETISKDYSLEFFSCLGDRFCSVPVSKDPVKHRAMLGAIDHLVLRGAIETVLRAVKGLGVYSMFFWFRSAMEI